MGRVILLSPPWRLITAALTAVSWLTLPTYLLAVFLLPPIPPVVMVRSFVIGTALPAIMAWGVARAFAGTATVAGGVLRLARGDIDVEVPCTSIVAARPWWVPLPRHGTALVLRSGGRLPYDVASSALPALLDGLARGGAEVQAARRHPSVVHAGTRTPSPWYAPLVKFAVLGTAPAGALFYTHQHIAYGGTFGQYYLEGAVAYLGTFAQYWANTVIMLISYASVWRAAAEVAVWLAGLASDGAARGARRGAEVACGLAYYAGVPAFLALRYLA